MNPKQFVFNFYQGPAFEAEQDLVYIYSNEPIISLWEEPLDKGARHEAQLARLDGRELQKEDPLFGKSLEWAYRRYHIWRSDTPPRDEPEQPVTGRALPLTSLSPLLNGKRGTDYLYLFNVIVALEWIPGPEYRQRLKWAFRRASDLLYDVTNGSMAFGQVVFADAEWMGCADIQIMASNRFLPRSWVSGLLEAEKYMAIRIGRGMWKRDRRMVIPWDEPEGYRAIVHEWAHYALGLKDEYLMPQRVKKEPGDVLVRNNEGDLLIVIPKRRITSESIMATPEGTSELGLPRGREAITAPPLIAENYKKLWKTLGDYYPGTKERFKRPLAGPGRLPLPLPYFKYEGKLGGQPESNEQAFALPEDLSKAIKGDEAGTLLGQWEIFVLDSRTPKRIIAQGEFDARSIEAGTFELLGAAEGYKVVVIGRDKDEVKVWQGTLRETNKARISGMDDEAQVAQSSLEETSKVQVSIEKWTKNVIPRTKKGVRQPSRAVPGDESPLGLVPKNLKRGIDVGPPKVEVQPMLPPEATLFPLGGENPAPISVEENPEISLETLEGLVLVRDGEKLLIHSYSQGGGPQSAPNVPSNPIAAGTGNGDALIFFHTLGDTAPYQTVRVITTTVRGIIPSLPPGLVAHSPVFSVASNERLPEDLAPTLMILNDVGDDEDANLFICRLDDGKCTPLPTYTSTGAMYAAAPLTGEAGGKLVADDPDGGRIESYVLGGPEKPPDGNKLQQ